MPLVLQIPTELHTWISYLAIPMRIGRKQVEKGGFGKQTNKQTKKQMRVFRYWMVSLKG